LFTYYSLCSRFLFQEFLKRRITNIFEPVANPATAEKKIAILTLVVTGAISVVVGGLIRLYDLAFPQEIGR
jgi:hypothetical protein